MRRTGPTVSGFRDGGRGHEPRKFRWPIEVGEGEQIHSPEETQPCQTLDFGLLTLRTVR